MKLKTLSVFNEFDALVMLEMDLSVVYRECLIKYSHTTSSFCLFKTRIIHLVPSFAMNMLSDFMNVILSVFFAHLDLSFGHNKRNLR